MDLAMAGIVTPLEFINLKALIVYNVHGKQRITIFYCQIDIYTYHCSLDPP